MKKIESIEELERTYDAVVQGAIDKVRTSLTPKYEQWIAASRFLILSTVGAQGTDASPRGDVCPVVQVFDQKTLLLPDWRGNNRLDSLRNIVEDGRVSLMFLVPGSDNVVRVNGTACLTTDEEFTSRFDDRDKLPRSVVVICIGEIYFQCAKSLMRSQLWRADSQHEPVPTAGEFIKEIKADFDAESYDTGYGDYAKDRMW